LTTALFAQVFRVGAPNAGQSALDVFRLEVVVELLPAKFQFSLPGLRLGQLRAKICCTLRRALLCKDWRRKQPTYDQRQTNNNSN
jgi:hypothetical protein